MTVIYCTVADVVRYLGLRSELTATLGQRFIANDDGTQLPSTTELESFINETEEEIEEYTHTAWREIARGPIYFDSKPLIRNKRWGNLSSTINLRFHSIRSFDADEGDAFDYWNGSAWVSFLTTKTEGETVNDEDYWLEQETGIIYVNRYYPTIGKDKYRVTYRYGKTTVPKDIKRACALLSAANFLGSDLYLRIFPDNTKQPSISYLIDKYESKAFRLLDPYQDNISGVMQ